MSINRLHVTLGLIAFAVFNLALPCTPEQRRRFDLTAVDKVARHLRGHYVVGYCAGETKDRAKLQVEVVDPEMRKAKPVLAYKRY